MSIRATEPAIFSTLAPDSIIRFKYSGGSSPGKIRTVQMISWFWDENCRHGYLQAYDSNGVFKTYHYSKMSMLYVCSTPEQESESENMTQNDLSNWTSWIKENDIIKFTYLNQTQIRNVTFINFMDRHSSTKQKIMCSENGYTKTFFTNKMTIQAIAEVQNESSDEDFESSPRVVQNEIVESESKKDILIKEMKAHINSLNITIDNLNEKCYSLQDQVQQAYSIMNTRRMRYSST
jgi:hypothetical protein